jgi:hypothetical protein
MGGGGMVLGGWIAVVLAHDAHISKSRYGTPGFLGGTEMTADSWLD